MRLRKQSPFLNSDDEESNPLERAARRRAACSNGRDDYFDKYMHSKNMTIHQSQCHDLETTARGEANMNLFSISSSI